MKKRNKMLALSLALSSLLLVGCAADQQANQNTAPIKTIEVASAAENALPSTFTAFSKINTPIYIAANEVVTSKPETTIETKTDSTSVKETAIQLIDEAVAKDTALAHADLNSSDVSFVKAKLDREDGRQVYEVEFYDSNYTEYDYEIDALNGNILDFDLDAEDFVPPVKDETNKEISDKNESSKPSTISEQAAKEIAAAQIPGATTDNIREFEADRDDGLQTYEGSLRYNGVEYEFEIDGSNGNILSWEIDD